RISGALRTSPRRFSPAATVLFCPVQTFMLAAATLSLRELRIRRPAAREHAVLRVSALLSGENPSDSARAARDAVLRWARNKTSGELPDEAWRHESFDHLSSGRNCSVVRLVDEA